MIKTKITITNRDDNGATYLGICIWYSDALSPVDSMTFAVHADLDTTALAANHLTIAVRLYLSSGEAVQVPKSIWL